MRVEGFNYIGMGNSTNKKDAQANAARDFVNYLVRVGQMSASEVPALGVSVDNINILNILCINIVGNQRISGPKEDRVF